jgi:GNAT superfamily N-acetyltransferase
MTRVRPATVHERGAALRSLLAHRPTAEREARVFGLLDLIRARELDPAGLLVLTDAQTASQNAMQMPIQGTMQGAILAMPVAGAGGLIWPPACETLAEAQVLVASALAWLRTQGTRIVQAMVSLPEQRRNTWLEACGFRAVTELWTLARDCAEPIPTAPLSSAERLTYEPYDPERGGAFEATLQATYTDSLDCPEVNGLRTIAEILDGHRVQGDYDPARWWLVREGAAPVSVVIQVDHPSNEERELAYLGLVPAARGRGLARAILARVLAGAAADRQERVILGVDARNQPALRLYTGMGFEEVERQRVFLRVDF